MQTIQDCIHRAWQVSWRHQKNGKGALKGARAAAAGVGEGTPLPTVTMGTIRHAFAVLQEDYSARTVNAYMRYFWQAMRPAFEDGLLDIRKSEFRLPRMKTEQKRALTDEEVDRILYEVELNRKRRPCVANAKMTLFVRFILLTGLRVNEVLPTKGGSSAEHKCTRGDWVETTKAGGETGYSIRVVAKGVKPHAVPLTNEACELLERAYKLNQAHKLLSPTAFAGLTLRNAQGKLKRAGDAANIVGKQVSAHALRRTFATRFARTVGNMRALQQILGHESITTTMSYIDDRDDVAVAGMSQYEAVARRDDPEAVVKKRNKEYEKWRESIERVD